MDVQISNWGQAQTQRGCLGGSPCSPEAPSYKWALPTSMPIPSKLTLKGTIYKGNEQSNEAECAKKGRICQRFRTSHLWKVASRPQWAVFHSWVGYSHMLAYPGRCYVVNFTGECLWYNCLGTTECPQPSSPDTPEISRTHTQKKVDARHLKISLKCPMAPTTPFSIIKYTLAPEKDTL